MISHPFASKVIILLIVAGVICPWPSKADTGKIGPKVIFRKSAKERLIIWCPWANEPLRNKFLNSAAVQFQRQTGAKLIIVFWNKNDLREKLVEKWRNKKTTPDLSYIDPGFKHPQIGNSLLGLNNLNLAPDRDPYWILGDAGGRSKNFLPIEGHETAIFYNKILFFKAGIKLPRDRLLKADEFLAIVKTLKANGITPIAEGSADRDRKAAIPIFNTMIRFAGYEKIRKLQQKQINFSEPEILQALNYWKSIVDAGGYDCEKSQVLNHSDSIFEMLEERAAISFSDTLSYSKFSSTKRIKGVVGVMDWFNVPQGKGNNTFGYTYGGGYGINRHSSRVELAKKFLQFLITPPAAELWTKHVQSPYPISLQKWPANSIYGELAAQRRHQKQTQAVEQLYFQDPALSKIWSDLTKKFICGDVSVEEFVQRMNSAF
jgi:ABC-type glycerol-3-phosphate transport system substrate-binding protein